LKIPDLKTDVFDDIKMFRITCFAFILSPRINPVTQESIQKLIVKIYVFMSSEFTAF